MPGPASAISTAAPSNPAQYGRPRVSPTLQGLPRSVLVEICLYLNPWTLVHLSRTSKRLRAMLLSPKVDQLWLVVREAEFAPRCKRPKDLTEAGWTILLCYKRCHVCQKTALRVLWSVHLRLCDGCEALLKAQHLSGGGTEETYASMFQFTNAFSARPTRRKLRTKFIDAIASALPPAEPQESPLEIVTRLWTSYLNSHGTNPHDPLGSGRFVPSPQDVLSYIESSDTSAPVSSLRLIPHTLEFPRIFGMWAQWVERGVMALLPPFMYDRDAALCVWCPVSQTQQQLHPPAWWPHAAHLYMHISKPEHDLGQRKPPQEVLRFDDRSAAAVQSLLDVFGLDDSTTVSEMDARDAYVQCAACAPDGEERDGLVYHWRSAVAHACTAHKPGGLPPWRVLLRTHAVAAGRRDRAAACAMLVWKCGVCPWASRRAVPRAVAEAHIWRVHELRPEELVVREHLYVQPDHDSLQGLAQPICLYQLLDHVVTLSVVGPSLKAAEANLNPDPLLPHSNAGGAAPDGEPVYIFCLRCPRRTRGRHIAQTERARIHFREQHGVDTVVLGCDYDYL